VVLILVGGQEVDNAVVVDFSHRCFKLVLASLIALDAIQNMAKRPVHQEASWAGKEKRNRERETYSDTSPSLPQLVPVDVEPSMV
jgi:hypothetical protein